MAPSRNRARQFAKLQDAPVKDYDPEDNRAAASDNESLNSENEDVGGTEHYAFVSKSKMRKPQEVALGSQYVGARVSRNALEESDEDEEDDASENSSNVSDVEQEYVDPDTVDLQADDEDGEIDSDDAFCQSDADKFDKFTFRGSGKPRETKGVITAAVKKRKTAADFMSRSEDESTNDSDADADEKGESGLEDSEHDSQDDEASDAESQSEEEDSADDMEEDEDEDDDGEASSASSVSNDEDPRAELRKIMKQEQKSVVAAVSKAAQADVTKGNAVKQQRKTFGLLLNTRIRLQKALVSINSMAADESEIEDEAPYLAAEAAATKLWNTLDSLRSALPASTPDGSSKKKRSRADFDEDTPTETYLAHMANIEASQTPIRNATLEKWSARVRGVSTLPRTNRLLAGTPTQSLTAMLAAQLADPERLIARTIVPRSCAPVQVARAAKMRKTSRGATIGSDSTMGTNGAGTSSWQTIFDDADMYQQLLKELIEQRSADAAAQGGVSGSTVTAATAASGLLPSVGMVKTKKVVDTRASKGRKMRFTVHEKLQNFMAPQDRGQWEDEAIDRFFSGLLGQKVTLGEESEDEAEPGMEDAAEESEDEDMGGIRLF